MEEVKLKPFEKLDPAVSGGEADGRTDIQGELTSVVRDGSGKGV